MRLVRVWGRDVSVAAMNRILELRRQPRFAAITLMAVLTMAYAALYFADPALPGNSSVYPEGWWGWWDQSKYLESARALARGDLAPERHWYPFGYSLLGAPFARMWPAHPFVLVNLAALLLTALAFLGFARRVGVGAGVAALLFLGSAVVDPLLLRQWAVPWNSSPTAAVIWGLLYVAAGHFAGRPRPFLLGALAAAVGLLRPTDLLVAVTVLAVVGVFELRRAGIGAWATVWRVALGGAVPVALVLALHVSVYGLSPSPYMQLSGNLGFSLHAYGWKAFNLLIEPRAWWQAGEGLLHRHGWLAVSLLALPFALASGWAMAMLAIAAVAHVALYVAYVDLLPSGFWLFLNVHYFKWVMPAFALTGWVGVRAALATPRDARWRVAAAGSAVILVALCLRVSPVAARDGQAWRALHLPGPQPDFTATYFGEHRLVDSAGVLRNVYDIRWWAVRDGTRVLALRRDILPPVEALPAGARAMSVRVSLGWPCWLPPYACKR
jgi:hypothetical protein